MENENSILEGVCPICSGDLKVVEISGTKNFLRDYKNDGWKVGRVWERGVTETGEIKSFCPTCEKCFYVYLTTGGDWVSN